MSRVETTKINDELVDRDQILTVYVDGPPVWERSPYPQGEVTS